jgi:programmed cell death protein 5
MDEDAELEELRERKRRELEKRAQKEEADQARQQQAEAKKKAILRQVLDSDARERLERIRMARPEKADHIESQLIQLAASGRIQQKLTDEQLKEILAQSQSDSRDINIERR